MNLAINGLQDLDVVSDAVAAVRPPCPDLNKENP